ncbi:hypothetical protein, partial [Actinocorallia lasiicapitis]
MHVTERPRHRKPDQPRPRLRMVVPVLLLPPVVLAGAALYLHGGDSSRRQQAAPGPGRPVPSPGTLAAAPSGFALDPKA